jgi:hypothetical protein
VEQYTLPDGRVIKGKLHFLTNQTLNIVIDTSVWYLRYLNMLTSGSNPLCFGSPESGSSSNVNV